MDEQISLKSMTMLIVDDDLLVLESLKKLFIKFEARVYSAKDGIEALAILKSTNIDFDLVISDINMPNLDGLSLLETTREFNKNINFIFVSAYTKPEYLLKAISHRAINYFRKPLDLKALLRCVIDISEDKHRKNLLELKEKNRKLLSQNAYYEDEIKQLKLEFYDSNRNLKDETNKFYQDFLAEKKVNEINIKKVISLTNDLELKEQEVLKLNEEVKSQNKIIVDLKDVIEHLEEKLELYK